MRNKRLRFAVQLLISLGVLAYLFFRIDVGEMRDQLAEISPWFVASIMATCAADRMVMAYKWRLLLTARGMDIPFKEVLKVYYFSTFVGMFLPVSVGGDLVRGFKLFKDGHEGADVASSILVERMLGLAAGAIVSVICSAYLWFIMKLPVAGLFYFSAAMLAGFIVACIASLRLDFLTRRVSGGSVLIRKLKDFYASYSAYRGHGAVLLLFLLLSMFEQIFPVLSHFFSARALHLSTPFWIFLVTLPVVQLVSRMPISFNGLGVTEGMLAYLFARLALSQTQAVTIGLVVEVASAVAMLPGMFFKIKTK